MNDRLLTSLHLCLVETEPGCPNCKQALIAKSLHIDQKKHGQVAEAILEPLMAM